MQLVKVYDGEETVLGSAPLAWEIEQAAAFELQVEGSRLRAWVNGGLLFEVSDDYRPLLDGAVALVCEEGYFSTSGVEIRPGK